MKTTFIVKQFFLLWFPFKVVNSSNLVKNWKSTIDLHTRRTVVRTQVQIAEAGNTAQYWPNLGNQRLAIVIGPMSPFTSVKCWADDFYRIILRVQD